MAAGRGASHFGDVGNGLSRGKVRGYSSFWPRPPVFVPAIPENSIAVLQDLASDMAAGVEFLRSRPEIDRNRIGLAGVSQPAWIVPMAAANTQPAFTLLVVGPTVSIGVEHFYSSIVDMRRP
jgi:hypothetical protein